PTPTGWCTSKTAGWRSRQRSPRGGNCHDAATFVDNPAPAWRDRPAGGERGSDGEFLRPTGAQRPGAGGRRGRLLGVRRWRARGDAAGAGTVGPGDGNLRPRGG